ncbi:Carboxymuconolactone decarboxylase [Mesorhizobium metallidurans STM 2683]|uniref:Carboxymuconolactone decarboxylase n=1 Tax=Mesorhizobium metallidurans STM 2683 TaxID=1297569 RepID=M5F2P6_9HYPH|nr:carboxymuconolactone decarboxylase family protein [Mesorhizobium metallidurans]CCV06086.1 Carboxymuconolactone decarboxylase [Mesorhizobium metallidurans STM 2683]
MKKLAASLVISSLAASTGEAQERPAGRVAPPAVYVVAPGLGDYTDELLFGDVWLRDELKPRDRSVVTVSALIASGRIAQVGGHVGRALDNGVTPSEIGEIITHLAFYSGWPNAISAVNATKEAFDARGIELVAAEGGQPLELDAAAEAARAASVDASTGPVVPALAEYTNRVLFGDLWRRPQLSARDRSLVTIAGLIATGKAEQLPFHLSRGMDNGLTRTELAEVATHLAYYTGWPNSMSAVPVLRAVFEAREAAAAGQSQAGTVSVRKYDPKAATIGSPENFTGSVRVESRFQAEGPARAGGGTVSFEPGARTAWHTHPLGQTLIVTAGVGQVQHWGGPVQEIRPGDVVWIPPGVKHWHGAAATAGMTHVAIAEALNGKAVDWMEQVTAEQYLD